MATLSRIHCYFGRHLRSRGRARRADDGWHSYCRRCGVEMFKEDGGEWYVIADYTDAEPGEEVGHDRSNAEALPAGTARTETAGHRSWRPWRWRG